MHECVVCMDALLCLCMHVLLPCFTVASDECAGGAETDSNSPGSQHYCTVCKYHATLRELLSVHCAVLNVVVMVDHCLLGPKPQSDSLLLQEASNFDGCI